MSISGALCARVADWGSVASHLHQLGARITRVDLRMMTLRATAGRAGGIDVRRGRFQVRRSQSNLFLPGDWKQVSGLGRSFYVGKRGHGKLLRVYEKGKQLGDSTSPWVRWEVELGNRDRVIPLAVVTEPAPYMAGAFPALAFVSAESKRIPTQRKVLQTSLQHLIACLGDSYGKTINAMLMQGYDPADIIAVVQRSGIPRRLPPAGGLAKGSRLYGDGRGEP
ncbi:MAG: replication initiation factor domain-containing protein [Betaproteobacteria bacterium]|nr:replication initiation factor domain-containing protein [Betaproteobacteria bacterium]